MAEWRVFFNKNLLLPKGKPNNQAKLIESNRLCQILLGLEKEKWIERRTDDYVVIGNRADIGLKLRYRSKIELKQRYQIYNENIEDWAKNRLGTFDIETVLSGLQQQQQQTNNNTKNNKLNFFKNKKNNNDDESKENKEDTENKDNKENEDNIGVALKPLLIAKIPNLKAVKLKEMLDKEPCCIITVSKMRKTSQIDYNNHKDNAIFEFAQCKVNVVGQWNTNIDIKSKIDNQCYFSLCTEMGRIPEINKSAKYAMQQLATVGVSQNDVIFGGYPSWLCKLAAFESNSDVKKQDSKDESKDNDNGDKNASINTNTLKNNQLDPK